MESMMPPGRRRSTGISKVWPAITLISLMLASACSWTAETRIADSKTTTVISDSTSPPPLNKTAGYRLIPTFSDAATTPSSKPPFSLLASGSENARIADNARNTLRAAPPGGTIFSFQMSPSNDYVLLHFGDAKYTLASADTLEDLLTLPSTPPAHDDATGISWWLLDDEYLLGEAELPSLDTAGKTGAEVEALLPRATLLYIYGLESRTLTPVEIDPNLPPIFSIHDVSGWNITLLTYDSGLLGAKVVPASK